MRKSLLGALVPVLVVAVILTRGGGGMQGEAKGKALLEFQLLQSASGIYNPVEQWTDSPLPDPSLYVLNQTGCQWSVDDSRVMIANGELAAGGSAATVVCTVLDPVCVPSTRAGYTACWAMQGDRKFSVTVAAASPALLVSFCYQPQARCWDAHPVWRSETADYRYLACVMGLYATDDPALVEIADSNGGAREFGGFGVLSTITTTVTNPTAKAVRDIRATAETTNVGDGGVGVFDGGAAGCVANVLYLEETGYPFTWTIP